MTDLSKHILEHYQIRKSKTQKTAFINLILQHFPNARVECGGLLKSRNIVIGDIQKAKFVCGAHYDTCAQLPFPNFITPKNIFIYLIYAILICIPIFVLSGGAALLINQLIHSRGIALIAFYIVLFALIIWMTVGPANKHTVNDNTSGVITLCEILSSMTDEQKSQIAVVFFDNEEIGLVGSSLFKKMHKKEMETKLLINFDCVSDGDHIMIIQSKLAQNTYGSIIKEAFPQIKEKHILYENSSNTLYPSDQSNFNTHLGIAAFNKKKIIGYYLDKIHTDKDTVLDEENIDYLKNCILNLSTLV